MNRFYLYKLHDKLEIKRQSINGILLQKYIWYSSFKKINFDYYIKNNIVVEKVVNSSKEYTKEIEEGNKLFNENNFKVVEKEIKEVFKRENDRIETKKEEIKQKEVDNTLVDLKKEDNQKIKVKIKKPLENSKLQSFDLG